MKTSETFCGVSGHGFFYRRLFPWIRIHELRYFTPTQIPPKLWQITARLFYYFRDNNLNFYLTQDEFYFKENGCARPILDFCVDSPEDLNPQYWKRYIFIWPIGVMHYNIDAKPPRQPLSKPPSEAVSEVISESPEN